METYDILIIHLYLLAIFTTLVKQKTSTNIYRIFKLFVVLLFVSVLGVIFHNFTDYTWWLVVIKVIPLGFLVTIMIQTEVRLLFVKIGIKIGLLLSNTIEENVKVELVKSIDYLSSHKIGALITFERNVSLEEFIRSAFRIDAPLNAELLSTIFVPQTPLHDGAVIIKGNIVKCAGTYFPSSENPDISKHLGSRHRAAIGISELTDALTIIVSEQTGQVSITLDGYLDQDISNESLLLYIEKYLQN